jgi:hypothetical protein
MNTSRPLKFILLAVSRMALLVMAAVGAAFASCQSNNCADTLSQIYLNDTTVMFKLTSGLAGLTNCTPLSGGYLTVPKSNANYTSYYALLLSASLTNQTITVRTTDSTNPCTVSYLYMVPPS